MADLAAFLKDYRPRRPGPPCWVCAIPERKTIDKERRARGAACGPQAIVEFLVAKCGYTRQDATRSKLLRHFQAGHHEE